MNLAPDPSGSLVLGNLLVAAGVDLADVVVLRHTSRPNGLVDVRTATAAEILDYTRSQPHNFRSGNPPKLWLVFLEDGNYDGNLRARFYAAFANGGQVAEKCTDTDYFYDLVVSPLLEAQRERLVIGWTARGFHRSGDKAANLRVLEIADPEVIPFPGFENFTLTYRNLQKVVFDPRYAKWQSALSAVKGIYLITDASTGKQYVGKADGSNGLFGRWRAYAADGHGGNVKLKGLITLTDLEELDLSHREHFVFSVLRVFGTTATLEEINAAEAHYKDALLTREWGYNAN